MNDNFDGHIVIVFALEHYNPLGLIRSLGEKGVYPVYISIKRRGKVACLSKYISKCHFVDTVEEGFDLVISEYGNFDKNHKPYILFSDDKSVGYFDLHYNEIKERFICYNAGQVGRINKFMNKDTILKLAKKHGFCVLDSHIVKVGDIPDNLVYPIITKDISPNSGNWKADVFICENEYELREAYKKITSSVIQLQQFIDKKNEYAIEGFTINKGNSMFIGTTLTWKYQIKGYYSPFHNVTMFNNPSMEEKLLNMFREIGFEGLFEVEFLIDNNDTYYFLETNFRASAWNYSSTVAGMPLSYLWVKSMNNGYIDCDDYKDFDDFTDMSEVIDFGKRVDTGLISLAEWLRDFKEAKGTYYYNKDDPAPFEMLFNHWEEHK